MFAVATRLMCGGYLSVQRLTLLTGPGRSDRQVRGRPPMGWPAGELIFLLVGKAVERAGRLRSRGRKVISLGRLDAGYGLDMEDLGRLERLSVMPE